MIYPRTYKKGGGGGGVDLTPPNIFFDDSVVGIFSAHLSISVAV